MLRPRAQKFRKIDSILDQLEHTFIEAKYDIYTLGYDLIA